MPTPEPVYVIDIVGEGRTDRGRGADQPEVPTNGVLPVLVHRLCNRPVSMRVRRRPLPFLQGKGLWQKVRFAKRQAFNSGSAGLVFVLDTEGNHPGQLDQLRRGVVLADGPTRPADVKRIRDSGRYTFFEITITEGRNRQVRRMVETLGAKVLKLVRTAIGAIRIGELQIGKYRVLSDREVRELT
jgi:hypothetical protein